MIHPSIESILSGLQGRDWLLKPDMGRVEPL